MHEVQASAGPWFRRYPSAAAGVAFALLVIVTVVRFTTGDERDATVLLYALPITLVGLAFGAWPGLAAAVGAVAISVVWVMITGADLTALGWLSRLVPLLLLGVLVGQAADALVDAEDVRVRLAVAEARRRDAAEIQDGIVQRLAVAKWSLEGGRPEQAIETLGEAIEIAEELVASLLEGPDRERVRPLSGG